MLTANKKNHWLSILSAVLILVPGAARVGAEELWPDLSTPAPAVSGGDEDAAVVVGIENYFAVPEVPGAKANARAWYDYFARTRGVPASRIKLLTDADATSAEMLDAARFAASKAGPGGTLWFVFIGHGAPSPDGKDGLLVGVDAQQKARYIAERSVRRGELLKVLSETKAGSIRVVLDACFSGKREDGSSIAPGLQPLVAVSMAGPSDQRMAVLTAAKADQFAGALPGGQRPAFSYLVLGGLRGWAGKAQVTAGSLLKYATEALDATLRGRIQTPELTGGETAAMGASAGERGPDLAALAKATAGASAQEEMFRVSNLPAVPRAKVPKAMDLGSSGLDFRSMDVESLGKYDEAFKFDKTAASAQAKAENWRSLAREAPKYADLAGKRAAEWDRFAAEQKAAEEARQKRIAARDSDWDKLSKLLAYTVVPASDKANWSRRFVAAYLQSPGLEPEMARDLARHVPAGREANRLKELAKSARTPVTDLKPGSRTYDSPGAYTFLPPAGVRAVVISLVGGGGGGGGSDCVANFGYGGGGGGGAAVLDKSVAVSGPVQVVVAAGGAGVACTAGVSGAADAGASGGSSSFGEISAAGGAGGRSARCCYTSDHHGGGESIGLYGGAGGASGGGSAGGSAAAPGSPGGPGTDGASDPRGLLGGGGGGGGFGGGGSWWFDETYFSGGRGGASGAHLGGAGSPGISSSGCHACGGGGGGGASAFGTGGAGTTYRTTEAAPTGHGAGGGNGQDGMGGLVMVRW